MVDRDARARRTRRRIAVVADCSSASHAAPEAWIAPRPTTLLRTRDEVDARSTGRRAAARRRAVRGEGQHRRRRVPTTAGVRAASRTSRSARRRWSSSCSTPARSSSGKTNLDQFATGLVGTRSPQYGACRNPLVPEFIAGGSSSGSAIVGGHRRGARSRSAPTPRARGGCRPRCCGIVGLKPTPGHPVERTASSPRWRRSTACRCSRRRCGDAARSVRRARAVASLASTAQATRPRRVRRPRVVRRRRRCASTFDHALDHVRTLGCTIVEIDAAPFRAAGALLYGSALVAERHAAFGAFAAAHPDAMDPAVAEIVRHAGEYPGADVFRALEALAVPPRGARADLGVASTRSCSRPSPASRRRRVAGRSVRPEPGARPPHRVRQPARPRRGRGAGRAPAPRACRSACRWSDRGRRRRRCSRWRRAFTGESLPSHARRGDAAAPARGRRCAPHRPAAEPSAHRPRRGAVRDHDHGAPSTGSSRSTRRRRKPGLMRTPGGRGAAIEVEVWALDAAGARRVRGRHPGAAGRGQGGARRRLPRSPVSCASRTRPSGWRTSPPMAAGAATPGLTRMVQQRPRGPRPMTAIGTRAEETAPPVPGRDVVDGAIKRVRNEADTIYAWNYERERDQLVTLYSKGVTSQWSSVTDLDWSTDVDPEELVRQQQSPDRQPRAHRRRRCPGSPLATWRERGVHRARHRDVQGVAEPVHARRAGRDAHRRQARRSRCRGSTRSTTRPRRRWTKRATPRCSRSTSTTSSATRTR